ncbi:RsmB/NOP family class I SAM-dependent RNA methyltransferase [Actinomyces provencensis]|uniref:RsmB/NOP family class I SAM-dependent RNA methyltransferase n=1 Tax=Actinomyces provencensis TaxID=1720198 RepID=UPI00096A2D42|nr:transcription antitermination factor NusB [Actinomyces provencensis]
MATHRYSDGYRALRGADPARLVAFDVLLRVETEGAYANLLLPRALREVRSDVPRFDSRDAAFTSELVYGTLRSLGRLDWVLQRHLTRPLAEADDAVRVLLRLGAHQLLDMRVPDHAAVGATVDLAREVVTDGPVRMVNAVLRSLTREGVEAIDADIDAIPGVDERLAVRHSHPEWMVSAFREALQGHGFDPGELEDLLASDNVPPLVTLVARPGLLSPGELADEAEDVLGTRVAPGGVSEYAVLLESGDPASLPSVRSGLAGAQDEGSQLCAQLAADAPVEGNDTRWLDLCAGPGGKAALLGALARDRGAALVANEIHPHRARLVERAVRALDDVEVVSGDGRTFGGARTPWPLGSFDRVLVDAPCTGMGSLRRRPESRWRRRPEDVDELTALQAALLDRALDLVRPGGVVAYVTCSPHLRETREQVERLLVRGDVELLDAVALAGELTPEPLRVPEGAGHVLRDGTEVPGRTLQLWGHRNGTDAMFTVLLRRSL